MNNILVIAAHPDDELLGVGSTIRKFVDCGATANAVILGEGLTSRKNSRSETTREDILKLRENANNAAKAVGYSSIELLDFPDNRFDEVDLLDIIKSVSSYVEKYQPDTIFTHHHGDLNIDHRRTCEAVLTACRPVGNYGVKRIYSFEIPSSTEWNFTYSKPFIPNVFIDVSETIEAKLVGMNCYETERTLPPHPRSREALLSLATYRGSIVGCDYAEAFMLLREVL